MYSRHADPRRVWKGGSGQHLLTPLPGVPGVPRAPGANSKKLYVAVFYNGFSTIALTCFVGNLYVHGICGEFGYPHHIPYNMLSIFRKKAKHASEKH